jgi:hypothetical protein
MSDAQREPCPRCGEPVALSLKACPFCGGSLLVDLRLADRIGEPRARYALAREISSFGPPALPFSTLRQTLDSPRPVLARETTRLAALRLTERLARLGLHADLQAAGSEPPPPSPLRGVASAGLGAAALLALLLGMRSGGGGAERAPARPPVRAGALATPSWPRTLSPGELTVLALPSVVNFHAGGRLSSGFLVAPGLALTRSAPLGDGSAVKILTAGGEEAEGEVVKRDDGIGLALVRVPGSGAEPLHLGDASSLRGGARVFFPVPTEGPLTLQAGAIGSTARQFQGLAYLGLEGSPPSGSEGGPVVDLQGRIVGLVAIQEGGAYVLPINYAYAEAHLLEPPQPAPDLRKWQDLLAEVETAERFRVDNPR